MKNKKIDKKVFENIFTGILDSSQKEILERFPELRKSLEELKDKDAEEFNMELFYPLEGVIRSVIAEKMKKEAYDKAVSSIVFIYMNYHFIESHFEKFVTIKEGSACCADKSRWLTRVVARYFSEGKPIDMTIDDKCYWKPHFWSAEQWIELFEALHNFYYGGFNEYMLFLQKNWLPLLIKPKEDK